MERSRVYLVYGNHGVAPQQFEDYAVYLHEAFTYQGFELICTVDPVPGAFNFVVEFFDKNFVRKLEEASQIPGTTIITIATEFLTGETFNNFPTPCPSTTFKGKVKWMVLKSLKGMLLRSGNEYEVAKIWHRRFQNFLKVMRISKQVWCVSPNQVGPYLERFGSEKIKLMPIVSWSRETLNPLQGSISKDIDFLFTGTMTPHRMGVIETLKGRGYICVTGPAIWPAFLRNQYVARSKVCLQILQKKGWRFPSVMRYHHLLSSGAVVVSEKASEHCFQEDFLVMADGRHIIDVCEATLHRGNIIGAGAESREKYFEMSENYRREFTNLCVSAGLVPRAAIGYREAVNSLS